MIVACHSFDPRSPCTSLVQPPLNYFKMSNPVVFFDMTIGGAPAGRIEMTLRADVVPKTVEVSDARQRFNPRSGRGELLH